MSAVRHRRPIAWLAILARELGERPVEPRGGVGLEGGQAVDLVEDGVLLVGLVLGQQQDLDLAFELRQAPRRLLALGIGQRRELHPRRLDGRRSAGDAEPDDGASYH